MPIISETTKAPACTAWCDETHDDWTEHPAAITKTCRRTISIMGEDVNATIVIERFATLDDVVTVDEPVIRFDCPDKLSLADARLFAGAMIRASELVGEAAAVAA